MESFSQTPLGHAIGSEPVNNLPMVQFAARIVSGIIIGFYFYFVPIPMLALTSGWMSGIALTYILYHLMAWRFYKKKGLRPIGIRISNWVDIIGSSLAIIVDPYPVPLTFILLLIVMLGNGMQHGLDIFISLVRIGIWIGLVSVILHFFLQMRPPPYPFYFYLAFLLVCVFHSFFLVQRLEFMKERAEFQSRTDELTGLMNRRAFFRAAMYIFSLRDRMPLMFVVVFVDLDGFKEINDTMGHDMGDRVLCKFAKQVKNSFRETDIISRYGGDEFVFLLVDTDIENAGLLMGRIEKRFTDWGKEEGINVGVSWGMKVPGKGCNDLDGILRQADADLYKEKTRKKAVRYLG